MKKALKLGVFHLESLQSLVLQEDQEFIEIFLEHLNFKSGHYETIECLLSLAIVLTSFEEEDEEVVATKLIDKGLLKIMAEMLLREEYQKFHPKVCAILCNIACDTEENRLKLIESEAF